MGILPTKTEESATEASDEDVEFMDAINYRSGGGESSFESSTAEMLGVLDDVRDASSAGMVCERPAKPPSSKEGIAPALNTAESVEVGARVFDVETHRVGEVSGFDDGEPVVEWHRVEPNPLGSVAFGTNEFHTTIDFTVR